MEFETTIWGTIIALALFIAIGAWLFVRSMQLDPDKRVALQAEGRRARLGIVEAARRYVGPVSPDTAFLTPTGRVALEFVAAFCGFPGFGWLSSTRVAIGLPMLFIGPAIIYGFYPALLATNGHLSDGPLVAFSYLPVLAVVSAAALAVAEVRAARAARGGRDAA